MVIRKILNNNVIVTENASGREVVAMGRGIAYKRRVGDKVPPSAVEKIYTISRSDMMDRFKELVASLSIDYLQTANNIIEHAETVLQCRLNDSVYISLTDHIHMAVHRIRNGISIRNMMLLDIKRFYEKEFQIGQYAVELMNKNFSVTMPDDEIGFIALHIVDGQLDFRQPMANRILNLMEEISSVVRMVCRIDFDRESLNYYRFITHLKFFAKRVFMHQESAEEIDDEMGGMIKRKYAQAYACSEKIATLVENKYDYKVSADEKFYLTIHIAKFIAQK
ncbi:MAG: PRD domain-containing protein [Selenomonadaceae bacterium]|nr:PRD domain-containing protein [Selenomonadaceae bacterium]